MEVPLAGVAAPPFALPFADVAVPPLALPFVGVAAPPLPAGCGDWQAWSDLAQTTVVTASPVGQGVVKVTVTNAVLVVV